MAAMAPYLRDPACEIFVGGCSPEVTEQIFYDFFAQYGEIVRADLKLGKGYGFIHFKDQDGVATALAHRSEAVLCGTD